MATSITTAEILQALEAAQKKVESPDDAFTVRELKEATGWGMIQIRAKLYAAKSAGRLESVRVARENLAGFLQPTIAYRIKPAPHKKIRGKR